MIQKGLIDKNYYKNYRNFKLEKNFSNYTNTEMTKQHKTTHNLLKLQTIY